MNGSISWRTPSLAVIGPRGLPIRQVEYLRNVASGAVQSLITRQQYDAVGHLVTQRDARLADALRPNLSTVYDLSGQPLKVDSVDAGGRINLMGVAGESLQRWDGRGSQWRTTYDNQLRVLTLEENAQGIVETSTYATDQEDPNHNLRGQLIRQVDASGEFEINSFSLHGQPLHDSRTITETGTFLSGRTYSPLGALLTQTDAGGHQQQMQYDRAGQLQRVQLRLAPTEVWQPALEDAQYNAAGQIIEQRAGNQVVSTWTYDDANGRLTALTAGVPGQDLLQHFQYAYDRVGNVVRIDDLAFKPLYFNNQRIDGHREFTYNSLYQLIRATGHDAAPSSELPGRPSPSDPNNHLNYTQRYEYDTGGNLIQLIHERAVGGYTHEKFIEPTSNRGVRWKEGEPYPDFRALFDRHGNQQTSAPGRPLLWNSRDQLTTATLVERDTGPNDEEVFRYSQGVRVFKRHEWHAATLTHFHQVIYLPGLEIRTRDNGEELHVITLPGGHGSVRCLHWVSKKPDGIDQDQLRYSLDDHLGSCLMELDQHARLISHEGYYPYGGTAWLIAVSLREVGYKTVRYSGKEMDECGLYYYGARYYAPWLQCWVSADPAGAVDGLNLYAFVGNNPLNYFDDIGEKKTPSQLKGEIISGFKFLSSVNREMNTLNQQLGDLSRPAAFRLNILKNVIYQAGSIAVGWYSSFHAAGAAGGAFPDFSDSFPHLSGGLSGMLLGNRVADKSTGMYAQLMSPLELNTPIVPHPSAFSADTLKERAGLSTSESPDGLRAYSGDELIEGSIDLVSKTVGAYIPGIGESFALAKVAEDANRAEEGLFSSELNEIESTLEQLGQAVNDATALINANFAELGINEFYDEGHQGKDYLVDLWLGRVGTDKARTVHKKTAQPFRERALNNIANATAGLNRYRNHTTRHASK
ncbi:RHS repeat-associated core domain protein containing protein [Pseudomonas sp. GM18]|uniref:RHS repeat domain-containing protein n=1 Tax=Pseudomonas sp. GM18 TaxID=1144324 RepID=UPI00027230B1|nr:RHS repeat-associated core domain-containing protein [Pseudomonas sp. GM18]EJM16129.1 RHS repeat-associated core domain protein containing protein [Pseudomonas sp. GM18]